jgi:hypothetical protein
VGTGRSGARARLDIRLARRSRGPGRKLRPAARR